MSRNSGIFPAVWYDEFFLEIVNFPDSRFHFAVWLVAMTRVRHYVYMHLYVLTRFLCFFLFPNTAVFTITFWASIFLFPDIPSYLIISFFWSLCLKARTMRMLVQLYHHREWNEPRKMRTPTRLATLGCPTSRLIVQSQVGRSRSVRRTMRIRWTSDGSVRCFRTVQIHLFSTVGKLATIQLLVYGTGDGRFCGDGAPERWAI